MAGVGELHRDFHSTPDLAAAVGALSGPRTHRSQEELRLLPPPSHPPPPIPATLVKVDVKEGPEYGNIAAADTNGNFHPIIAYSDINALSKVFPCIIIIIKVYKLKPSKNY